MPNTSDSSSAAPALDASLVGPRQTRQRDAILRVIQDSNGPLSVPEIHERARQTLPKIGIATIYRTLKLLQASDQILVVILPSGETRYENTGLGHHDHFQCRRCRNVFDLPNCPLHLDKGTSLPGGFIVEDHEMTLYGTCPQCAPAITSQTAPATSAKTASNGAAAKNSAPKITASTKSSRKSKKQNAKTKRRDR